MISDSQRGLLKAQYAQIIDEAADMANQGAGMIAAGQITAGEYRLRMATNKALEAESAARAAVKLFERLEDQKDTD